MSKSWLEIRRSSRKVLSLTLAFLMIFSSFSFAEETSENDNIFVDVSNINMDNIIGSIAESKLSEDLINLEVGDEEEIRLIVEFDKAPIIESATARGLKVTELNESTVKSLAEAIDVEQTEAISTLDTEVESIEIHQRFDTVFNGVSMTVKAKDVDKIANLDNVKSVYIANKYERPQIMPNMSNSFNITNSAYANEELGFAGEGLVVAVIDSGIDPYHKDMQIDPTQYDVELDSSEVGAIIAEESLPGKYFSAKVPYGYNYMDNDYEIRDLGAEASMHGMHVAGSVAADGELKGVAPKAQLLAMKVFGNDPQFPSTFGDTIIAAIDDSIALGADVMNLSLGATSTFVDKNDPEQQAITRATENGIIMSISAGNSAMLGYGHSNPYASNPDIGVVGSPGLVYESIQVASVDNYGQLYNNTVNFTGMAEPVMGYGKDGWSGSYELVAIGGSKLGKPEDYDGIDVTGKVVLVSRGALSFLDKTENAAAKGAVGIVCYDHGLSTFYKNQGGWSVPFMKISKADGQALEALLTTNDSISFTATNESYVNPTSGKLSSFSSWGVTPDMGFKPDIAAPGGNIYSLANNNEYQYKSGTSMAAPHVAGGAALVKERIEEDQNLIKLGLTEQALVDFSKNILMNTAVPVKEASAYTSPRGQGAGSMDLRAALTTTAVAYEKNTGLAKVNLGEISDKSVTYKIKVKNFGTEKLAYDVNVFNQSQKSDGTFNYLSSLPLNGVDTKIYVNGSLLDGPMILKANQTKTIKIVQNFENVTSNGQSFEELWPNGGFVEGFVFISPAEDYRADYAGKTAEADKAVADNQVVITDLMNEIATLEASVPAKEEAIANLKIQIAELQGQIDAKQTEIDTYKADHADEIADVLALLAKIEEAEGNVKQAIEAYEATKGTLIENAQNYSIAGYFQGNYAFLNDMFEAIDGIEAGEENWYDVIPYETRVALNTEINEVISVLNEYETVVNGLTVEGFLDKTAEERAAFLKDLTDKVENLQVKLNAINDDLDGYNFAAYANWIENTKLPEIQNIIDQLTAQLESATEEEKVVLQEKIAKRTEKLTIWKDEMSHSKLMETFVSNVQESITLNSVILDQSKDLLDDALIVDNAKSALSLLQATYTAMDLSVYDTYKEGLAALEAEKATLETQMVALDKSEALTAELDALKATITTKKEAQEAAEGLVEGLEKAAADTLAEEKAFGEMVDRSVELSVPYIGFRGEWNDAPIFDALSNTADTFYGYTGLIHVMNPQGNQSLLMDINAMSPNGDGYQDKIQPIFSAMRNLKNLKVEVVKNDRVIKVLALESGYRKNWYDGGEYPKYNFLPEAEFDGMVNFKVVPDGEYVLRYTGELFNGHAQTLDVPFLVDVTKPTVGVHSYSTKTKIFSVSSTDNLSGIKNYHLLEPVFDDNYNVIDIKPLMNNKTGVFDLSTLDKAPTMVMYAVEDNASNSNLYPQVVQLLDYAVPEMTISVKAFSVLNTRTINYTGTLFDVLPSTVTIDGKPVTLTDEGKGNYSFSGTANYDSDGRKGIVVEAQDLAGNRVAFTRWFFVDSTASEIEVKKDATVYAPDEVIYLNNDTSEIDLNIRVADNFPEMKIKVNGSVVKNIEASFKAYEGELKPSEYTFDHFMFVYPKVNRVEVSVEDAAGTVTTENYYFYVMNENNEQPTATNLIVSGDKNVQAVHNTIVKKQYTTTLTDQFGDPFKAKEAIVWSVEGNGVSISEQGLLTITDQAAGEIKVVATLGSVSTEYKVNVAPIPASKVTSLAITGASTLQAVTGQSVTSQYFVTAKDQYDNQVLVVPVWSVEGDNVSISNGLLTVGEAASGEKTVKATFGDVTATYKVVVTAAVATNNNSSTPTVNVTPPVSTGGTTPFTPSSTTTENRVNVRLNQSSVELEVGSEAVTTTAVLSATVSGTSNSAVVWSSSNEEVATVDSNGIVTAVSAGTATIKASREDGSESASAAVEVFLVGDETTPLGAVSFSQPYMNGYEDGTFRPEGTITRAELAVVYSKILGLNTAIATKTSFEDVKDHWALQNIEAATRVGIFTGYSDGTFKPNQPVNRGELAATFSKFWALKNIEVSSDAVNSLTDVSDHWASAHIYKLVNAKVLESDLAKYEPEAPATRGQVVVMINNLLGRESFEATTSKFKDVKDTDMMGAIEAATSVKVEENK